MRRGTVAFLLGWSVLPLGRAEVKPFTAADLWAVQTVADPQPLPDGRHFIVSIAPYDAQENKRNGDLWLGSLDGTPLRRLTSFKGGEAGVAVSPDGTRIAFSAKRDGDEQTQIYLLPLDGGEAQRLTELPLGASQPRWLPDGKRLLLVSTVIAGHEAPTETKLAVAERKERKISAIATENRTYRAWDRWLDETELTHLFLLDLETKAVTDLMPGHRALFELQDGSIAYDVAPDGTAVAFAANATAPPYRTHNYDIFHLSLAPGSKPRNLTADNRADDSAPVFTRDGKSLLFGRQLKADGWPDRTRLARLDLASGRVTTLTESWDASPSEWVPSSDGTAVLFLAEQRGRTAVFSLPLAGGTPQTLVARGTCGALRVTSGGELLMTWNDLSHPSEIATAHGDGSGFRVVTQVNDALLAAFRFGAVRDVTFNGAANEPVQMYIVEPPGFDPNKQWPLLHLIHGGPHGSFGDNWHLRWNAQVFAQQGYVVALVNFHGSTGFGQKFLESILGAHGDKPFVDVMKATDWLIAQRFIDPERMAAAGGSYGGYLVDWIAGHTNRFKALVSHAGPYNLLGQFASDATLGRHLSYGGFPFTDRDAIERYSPNRFAAAMTTPMLITHGEKDYRVPYTQSLELHGTLSAKGVPSRLVVYPDENHWILKGQNAQHWYGEAIGWLNRWLASPTRAVAAAP